MITKAWKDSELEHRALSHPLYDNATCALHKGPGQRVDLEAKSSPAPSTRCWPAGLHVVGRGGQIKRPRDWRAMVIILTKVQHRLEGPWEYDGTGLSSHKQLHIYNGFF